jgi:hypothetical protein
MMEILFDDAGQRYVRFSKNRRGGSAVGKRLYFRLEDGEVVYDGARYKENEELREIEDRESIRQVDLSQKFEEIFIGARQIIDESSVADDDEEETDGIPFEIYQGEDN